MVTLRSRFPLSRGSRGIFLIAGGTAGGQLVGLATAPFLTRIYSPGDLGLYTVIFALVSALATVAALRLELAVPLPDNEEDARSVVILGLTAAISSAVIGTAAVALLGRSAAEAYGQPALAQWLWFVPAIAAITSTYLILSQLAVRQRRYGSISRRNLLQSVTLAGAQISAGANGFRPGGLVLGLGIAQAAGAASLLIGSGLNRSSMRVAAESGRLRSNLVRFSRFPLVLAPSGLLNVLGIQLPVLVISYAYGAEVAGWLGLSQRVLAVPVTLLGAAVAQVYVGELVAAVRSGSDTVAQLFLRTSIRLGLVGLLVAAVVAIGGPWLFGIVFGSEWTESGHYARALAVGLAAQLVAAPLSQTLIVFERTFLQLGWDAGRLALTGGATLLCASLGGGPAQATLVFGISAAVAYGVSWMLSWRTVKACQRPHPEPS